MTEPTLEELLLDCEHVIRKFQDTTGPVNRVARALRSRLLEELATRFF